MPVHSVVNAELPTLGYFDMGDVFDLVFDFTPELTKDGGTDTIVTAPGAILISDPHGDAPLGFTVGDATLVSTPVGDVAPPAPTVTNTYMVTAWVHTLKPGEQVATCTVLTTQGRVWNKSVRFDVRQR